MKHLYHLDSIRGLLSLVVVMQHASAAFIYSIVGPESSINTYLGLAAHYSVLFFFALSGYVITLSIVSNASRNGRFSVLEYVTSRTIRILPPLLGALLISWFLFLILRSLGSLHSNGQYKYAIRDIFNPDIVDQLRAIFTLTIAGHLVGGNHNVNGALWSLVFEIQFYVIAGLIALIISTKKASVRVAGFILVAIYLYKLKIGRELTMQVVAYACFLFGALAFLHRDRISRNWFILPVLMVFIIGVIGALCGWSNIIIQLRGNIASNGPWMIPQLLLGLGFAVSIVFAENFGRAISIFNKLSSCSYSLYIVHFPVIIFLWFIANNKSPALLDRYYLLSFLAIIICVLFAKVFSLIFEQPRKHKDMLLMLFRNKDSAIQLPPAY